MGLVENITHQSFKFALRVRHHHLIHVPPPMEKPIFLYKTLKKYTKLKKEILVSVTSQNWLFDLFKINEEISGVGLVEGHKFEKFLMKFLKKMSCLSKLKKN